MASSANQSTRPTVMAARTETQLRDLKRAQQVLPVIEEELQGDKRQVQRGGVHVHTTIEETPVRRSTSSDGRLIGVGEADTAFKEQSFELNETDEEMVVSKQARVVEEVVVNQQGQDRIDAAPKIKGRNKHYYGKEQTNDE